VFATAVAVFGLASVACAACTGLWPFVFARVIQGTAGALMTPVGRIVVLRNTDKAGLLKATSLITWPGLLAPVIAPVLGGALTTWFGWQWNFLLNAPLAAVGTFLVLRYVPDHRVQDPKALDRTGTVLIATALSLGIYGLSQLAQASRLSIGLGALLLGAGLTTAAIWWLRRSRNPLIDLAPLRVATFAAATLHAGNLIRIAISATPFLLPVMLEVAWHMTPLRAGETVLVYSLGNLVMKTVTTPLMRALGFRTVLVGNGLAVALSIAACGLLTAHSPAAAVYALVFLAGATRSIEFTGINTLSFADIEPAQQAPASTFFSMMQQVSMALGVSAGALLLTAAHRGATGALSQSDFTIAFGATALLALIGAALMLTLRRDAGHEVTGHAPRLPDGCPAPRTGRKPAPVDGRERSPSTG
jgi:MFS family permease